MADWNPISACGAKAVLADSDPDIKAAYLLTMNMWHAETVAIIEQGLASGEFRSAEPAADIAGALSPRVRPRRDLCAGRAGHG